MWFYQIVFLFFSCGGHAQQIQSFGSLIGNRGPANAPLQRTLQAPRSRSLPTTQRKGRRFGALSQPQAIEGGVDFSQAVLTEEGKLCVVREENVETVQQDPVVECSHKNVEKCHFTYVTSFTPTQEEECHDNFQKTCQINFIKEASTEAVEKCYRPLVKVCNDQGEDKCETKFESSCTTRYVEKSPGNFVGDTKCEKVPVEVCGQGCITEEAPEECHKKMVDTLVDVPEETCNLDPQETCRFVTRLVPKLRPIKECTNVPKETCVLKFSSAQVVTKPLRTEWCLDETEDNSLDDDKNESNEVAGNFPVSNSEYSAPTARLPTDGYSADISPLRADYSRPSADLLTSLQRLRRFVRRLRVEE